jgi:hypothetical protein
MREEVERRQRQDAPTPAEAEAERAVADFYSALGDGDAKGDRSETAVDTEPFCDLMSAGAQTQAIRYAEVSSGIERKWDCESAVEVLLIRAKRTGGLERAQAAEVIGVNAAGDRATATVRFGRGAATAIPLAKEDGEWKLAATELSLGR